jgi:hypothetical protein
MPQAAVASISRSDTRKKPSVRCSVDDSAVHLAFDLTHVAIEPGACLATATCSGLDARHRLRQVVERLVHAALLLAAVLALDLARQRFDALVKLTHRLHDAARRLIDLGRQLAHGVGHHAEAAAGLARSFGFHRCVERHQAGLQRDLGDLPGSTGHVAQRVDDARHLAADVGDRMARTLDGLRARAGLVNDRVLPLRDLAELLRQRLHLLRLRAGGLDGVIDRAAHLGRVPAER